MANFSDVMAAEYQNAAADFPARRVGQATQRIRIGSVDDCRDCVPSVVDDLVEAGVVTGAAKELQGKTEMDALIAYLQNLGTAVKRGN